MNSVFMLYGDEANLLNSSMALKKSAPSDKAPPATSGEENGVTFDDLLVAVGKSRNRDAFIRLFEYFAPRIKSFLMKGGLTQEMADELAQETMLSVWQKAGSYDPSRAAAATWIFTIARNKRIDFFRKSGRPEPDAADPLMTPDPAAPAPDYEVVRNQEEKQLEKAIEDLPEEQAEMIRKAFLEEKTHAAIAEETGLPLGTVKSRIRLALERLRYHLGAEDESR